MKILIVHNRYQTIGGEDAVFEGEQALLTGDGHDVQTIDTSNSLISSKLDAMKAGVNTIYSISGRKFMSRKLREMTPDIVHVHNFFPLLSPSIFDACRDHRVPVVLTLHNYRVACANGILFRNGEVCEACIGGQPWSAVAHRCYRDSTLASFSVAAMIGLHSRLGTWKRKVDRFIALTDFARDIYIRAGIPGERISVKPNFAKEAEHPPIPANQRKGFMFAGRLTREKGIDVLLDAWRGCQTPLTIIGAGPLSGLVKAAAETNQAIRYLGFQPRETVLREIAFAKAVVVPSLWYENYPMIIVEAFARGTPVIASTIGALPDIVQNQIAGILFDGGSSTSLQEAVRTLESASITVQNQLISSAHERYRSQMSPSVCLSELNNIYLRVRNDAVI